MGVPTPTSAPTPFPEGDPRNGKYFENLAALQHQLDASLAGDQQDLTGAQVGYDYSTGQLDRQLPLTLQGTRNTANSQGLLESGQLAQRSGSVEARYAAQRGRLASNLQQEQNRVHQAESQAQDAFNLGRSRAATAAREEALAQTEQTAPNEQAPVVSKPPAAPAAPVAARSWVQQATSGHARARAARNRAMKKAVG
jgi:hypothetical protein